MKEYVQIYEQEKTDDTVRKIDFIKKINNGQKKT